MNFTLWLHILLITAIYLSFALIASKIIKVYGGKIKEITSRTSSSILFISAITNTVILLSAILILIYIDKLPVSSLGLNLTNKDILFTISSIIITIIAEVAFIIILSASKKLKFSFHFEVENFKHVLSFIATLAVLFIVAVQEEVVFRGYIILNLIYLGPAAAIIISSVIFALIHFPTNKITLPQVSSWLLVGIIFAYIYLMSGSIIIVIILHFFIDLSNVMIFNIAGKFSLTNISPPLNDKQRLIFRIVFSVFIFILVSIIYGNVFNLYQQIR